VRRAGPTACVVLTLLAATSCATQPAASPQAQVEAAFDHYCTLMLAMDHAAIAAMFSADGEIVNAGQAPIRGPAMINAFLAGFSDYKVLAYTTDPPQTRVNGDYANLRTIYHEKVRVPDGRVAEVSGHLEALWRRSPRGPWYVTRMATAPL